MKKKLKEIVTQIRGVSYKPTDIKSEIDGIPILRANNIQDDGINLDELVYIDSKKVHEEQYLKKGDIVICASSGSKNLVGKAATYNKNEKASFGAFCKVVRVNESENLCKEFVQQYFQSKLYRNAISELSIGANINNIKTEHIDALEINVPSLPEQQKIAAHLDSIQSAIDNKKQQLQQLDELVKSKFVEMFGENPVESGKWKVEKLDELCSKISDGVHAKPEYTEIGMPFISVVNMNTGKLSFNDCKFVSVEAYEKMIKSTNPEKDDVLYTKVGATYGISALVDTDKKFCLYVSVALLKPLHDKIDSQFLTSTMMMPYVKQQADNSIKGIGVPDLHLNQIRAFKIAVPPIELQNTFAEYVQKIDSAKLIIKTQLVDLQELLDSKMDEYFGE